jgi:hypothetical protein
MQSRGDVMDQLPRHRWMRVIAGVEAATGALLLGIALVTVAGHVTAALTGTSLVFSQEEMDRDGGLGPAPIQGDPDASTDPLPADETVGSSRYVDVVSIGLTVAGGLVGAAGAVLLGRRSRWSVPAAAAGMVVAGIVGAVPALVGIWAASFYGTTSSAEIVALVGLSAVLVGLAVLALVTIWRNRAAIGPAQPT